MILQSVNDNASRANVIFLSFARLVKIIILKFLPFSFVKLGKTFYLCTCSLTEARYRVVKRDEDLYIG